MPWKTCFCGTAQSQSLKSGQFYAPEIGKGWVQSVVHQNLSGATQHLYLLSNIAVSRQIQNRKKAVKQLGALSLVNWPSDPWLSNQVAPVGRKIKPCLLKSSFTFHQKQTLSWCPWALCRSNPHNWHWCCWFMCYGRGHNLRTVFLDPSCRCACSTKAAAGLWRV